MTKVVYGTLILIVLVGGILLVDRSARINRPVPSASKEAGKVLPTDLGLTSFPAREKVGFDKFKGKVVLVNFWASWCEACMAEMPSIQKLYEEFKDKGLEVVAVNVDDNPDKVVPGLVSKLRLTFPIFTDAGGALSKYFEVVAIPYSVVADREQRIAWAESGERDWSSVSVKAEIRKLLGI